MELVYKLKLHLKDNVDYHKKIGHPSKKLKKLGYKIVLLKNMHYVSCKVRLGL